jgi:excinuclease ABC subunit B
VLHLLRGQELDRRGMLEQLVQMQFTRTTADLKRGTFRMRGQVFEIMPVNEAMIYRFEFGRNRSGKTQMATRIDAESIVRIEQLDPVTRAVRREQEDVWFFPAKHYVVSEPGREMAFASIRKELEERLAYFAKKGKMTEHDRLKRRVRYDLDMIKNLGYCSGIENYSRHFDGRLAGEPPFTLIDYFSYSARTPHPRPLPRGEGGVDSLRTYGFLTVIDESHVTVSQIRGMYAGDKARKDNLVDYGFRLPSARDNRPLTFDEFEKRVEQTIYVSATPTEYELKESDKVVEQIVRPTGLIDPEVVIRPITGGKASLPLIGGGTLYHR